MGDLIISRRNDPDVTVIDNPQAAGPAPMVRNGNRWRVAGIDQENYRIAAVRLNDGAGAVFTGDYLREHINLGYAVTVHSAQGVTADTSHAVLGENTTRNLLYVAMTRGRHTNTSHLYERVAETIEQPTDHIALLRGDSAQAAQLARSLIANDNSSQTAHQVATQAAVPGSVSGIVADFMRYRAEALKQRRIDFETWQVGIIQRSQEHHQAREQGVARSRNSSSTLDR